MSAKHAGRRSVSSHISGNKCLHSEDTSSILYLSTTLRVSIQLLRYPEIELHEHCILLTVFFVSLFYCWAPLNVGWGRHSK